MALLSFHSTSIAQMKVSSDSLLRLIEEAGDVFKANFDWKELDYNDCQQNTKLKPYLLQLINREACFLDKTNRYIDLNKDKYVQKWLDKQPTLFVDSIIANQSLMKFYTDSIVEVIRKERKKGEKLTYKLFPEQDCLDGRCKIFKQIKWPEVYDLLRKQWVEGYRCADLFSLLLEYQDPDAWKAYLGEKIESEMKTIGDKTYAQLTRDGIHYVYYNWICNENICSYDVDMFLRLLTKQNSYARINCYEDIGINKDTLVPLNIGLIHSTKIGRRLLNSDQPVVKEIINSLYTDEAKEIMQTKKFHGREEFLLYTRKSPLFSLPATELEKISKKIALNKEAFRKALQPLMDEIEKRDAPWKKNMAYSKKKAETPTVVAATARKPQPKRRR